MKTAEFLQYSFAENGDKNSVPITTDPQGGVSIQSGYPIAYSNDPSAGGKYIERPDFNWILNYFTKEIQAIQLNGINELNNTILTSVGYPKGARCAVWINVQTHKLDRNGATNALCITIPIVSMKDNNQTDPYTSDSAVFGDWWIDDGNQLSDIKIVQTNLSSAPSGYIDLAPDTANPSYVKADYPRINAILGTSTSSQWGYFKSTSATNFTIINPRGYFPRVWSNGSTIDSGRDFLTLQNDAMREIEGRIGFMGSQRNDISNYWTQVDENQIGSLPTGSAKYGEGKGFTGPFYQKWEKALDVLGDSTLIPTQNDSNIHGNINSYLPTRWFKAGNTVPTANENRPYNFNSKWYIKA